MNEVSDLTIILVIIGIIVLLLNIFIVLHEVTKVEKFSEESIPCYDGEGNIIEGVKCHEEVDCSLVNSFLLEECKE